MKPATKDPRLEAKRAKVELADLVEHARDPNYQARPGAEEHGIWVVRLIVAEYIVGESELAQRMRSFLDALCDKSDPLRRDIRPDHWALLWSTINTLRSARESHLYERAEAAEAAERLNAGPRALGPGAGEAAESEGGAQ